MWLLWWYGFHAICLGQYITLWGIVEGMRSGVFHQFDSAFTPCYIRVRHFPVGYHSGLRVTLHKVSSGFAIPSASEETMMLLGIDGLNSRPTGRFSPRK